MPKAQKPWQRPGWPADRLRELLYQLICWPYLIALAITWAYLHDRSNAVLRDAMVVSWGLAFARREWRRYVAQRYGEEKGGRP
ncbi:MAG: hypothetical protein QN174_13345 [Armatimonadota bacterium]|nr:hypothetical protein [Armatimonadota bacterium]